jgi:hypothetical protein
VVDEEKVPVAREDLGLVERLKFAVSRCGRDLGKNWMSCADQLAAACGRISQRIAKGQSNHSIQQREPAIIRAIIQDSSQ